MAASLLCVTCSVRIEDSQLPFYLFSCGDLACALHVTSPFCVNHSDYLIAFEVSSVEVCTGLVSELKSVSHTTTEHAHEIRTQLTEKLRDYLDTWSREYRQHEKLQDVYPNRIGAKCGKCQQLLSSDLQVCEVCKRDESTPAILPPRTAAGKCQSCKVETSYRYCQQCQQYSPLLSMETIKIDMASRLERLKIPTEAIKMLSERKSEVCHCESRTAEQCRCCARK